mmetsp:Transcript_82774/g.210642  ORF Transcript_82774/g.210642 Transcript_82774/m.210642 type:complete len:207 (-) Transcript_82774:634-1254(-)
MPASQRPSPLLSSCSRNCASIASMRSSCRFRAARWDSPAHSMASRSPAICASRLRTSRTWPGPPFRPSDQAFTSTRSTAAVQASSACWMEANRRSTSAQSSSMRISNARREARASASPAMSRSSSSTESFVSSSFHAAASFGCATLACRPTCSARAARAAILMFGVGAGLATGAPVWGGGTPGESVDCSGAACCGTECGGAASPPG